VTLPRFVILAEGKFHPLSSKTANACIRYAPDRVKAVIDSTQAGRTAQQVLGFGGRIPVVAALPQALRRKPDALLIGIAPSGGHLPPAFRRIVLEALAAGLDVWSGLHDFLADDPEFAAAARRHRVTIHDLRRPPKDLPVSTGRVRHVDATVVLTVGTDCNIGKMTTQLQVRDALRRRKRRVAFAATGQTGILVEGWGIAVDAVIADFIAGAAEELTLEGARRGDIVLVEGQGSLVHPGYSGVTYGLIHGSLPHALLLCHQPSRRTTAHNDWVPLPSLTQTIRLHEDVTAPLRPAPVIGIALNTYDLTDAEAKAAIRAAEEETGLPCTDPVRYDPRPLAEAIEAFHDGRLAELRDGLPTAAAPRQRTAYRFDYPWRLRFPAATRWASTPEGDVWMARDGKAPVVITDESALADLLDPDEVRELVTVYEFRDTRSRDAFLAKRFGHLTRAPRKRTARSASRR
jgi:uncharacterized NAD-dependent epimerase/dehydratase family protein